MIKKSITTTITSTLAMSLISFHAAAENCPDRRAVSQHPAFPMVEKTGFDHWANRLLSNVYTPYHMVHDALVGVGETATLVGKFDYDWAMHKDLEDEDIKIFLYGTGMNSWEYLGTYTTDSDGKIYVPVNARPAGHYMVRMIAEGDLSSATGYLTVIKPGTKSVLFDIDGTLTLSDYEAVGDYLGITTAQSYYYAPETVNAYREKGYCITYLSARPYWLMKDTREWQALKNIPLFHTHTNPNAELFENEDITAFKADYIKGLMASGLDIVRVYGNTAIDIAAYAEAGIPKSETYIMGDLAGEENTNPLNDDYSYHYSTVVVNTPDAQ